MRLYTILRSITNRNPSLSLIRHNTTTRMVRDLATDTKSKRRIHVAILDSDTVPDPLVKAHGSFWSESLMSRLQRSIAPMIPDSNPVPDLETPDREVVFSQWHVEQGQYPDPRTIDAVLLSGGKASVYWPDAWIPKLQAYILDLYQNHPNVKMVGICLGHQMIAQALLKDHGVVVEKSPRGFQMGIRTVDLDEGFCSRFPNMRRDLRSMRLHVVHGDHVHCPPGSLPAGWMTIGRSECCDVHGLYEPGRVLTLQSHFEMTRAICEDIINFLNDMKGWALDPAAVDALLENGERMDDGEVAGGLILSFLTSG